MHIPIRVVSEGSDSEGACHQERCSVSSPCVITLAFGERAAAFTAWRSARLAVQNAQSLPRSSAGPSSSGSSGGGTHLASILDINKLLTEIVRLIQWTFGFDHVGLASSKVMQPSTGYAGSCGRTRLTFSPNHFKVSTDGSGEVEASQAGLLQESRSWYRIQARTTTSGCRAFGLS